MGEEPVSLGGVKERCLLAALALHCGEAVSVASLVEHYFLGGQDNFEADRIAAEKVLALVPRSASADSLGLPADARWPRPPLALRAGVDFAAGRPCKR